LRAATDDWTATTFAHAASDPVTADAPAGALGAPDEVLPLQAAMSAAEASMSATQRGARMNMAFVPL
jgi:hypothetical protein